jgi:hypothetical protein
MHKFVRTGSFGLSLLMAMQQPMRLSAQTAPEAPRPRMSIAVIEGEGTINNVRDRKPINVAVLIRDGNRKPIAGASVTFTLPAEGASAAFSAGARTVTIQSDKDGYASVQGIRPNTVPGPYQVQIEARHNDETAKGVITQYNMIVDSRGGGGSGKWIAVVAAIGAAAAAGGAVALRGKGGNGNSPAATAPTPIGIAPGSGSVGPPR